jgi:hypothetical protein
LRLAQFHFVFHIEDRFAAAVADMNVNRMMLVAVEEKLESVLFKNRWQGCDRFNQCAASIRKRASR